MASGSALPRRRAYAVTAPRCANTARKRLSASANAALWLTSITARIVSERYSRTLVATPRGRLIAVEGPIGAGKTTLAQRLAERLDWALVLEPVEENAFLDRFYEDPRALAFRTQLFFLVNRFHQQRQIEELLAVGDDVVTDYALWKDRLFARLNLAADELALYEEVYDLIAPRAPRPALLALLRCDLDTLLARIRGRDRPFERPLTRKYLERVAAAYEDMAGEATFVLDGNEGVDELVRHVEA